MARREYKGGAPQIILSGNIAASGVTTINTTGTVTNWPTGSTGKFLIVIDKGNASEEKIFCTSRTGNALSVASDADRGADGTSAVSHVSGVTVNHCVGAVDLDEPNAHINDTTLDSHTQYLKADGTRVPTGTGGMTAIAGSSAVGDSASAGTAATLSRSDHRHGREAFATPVATGTANAAGSAATVPHSDHVHLGPGTLGFTAHTSDYTLTTSYTDVVSVTVTTVAGRRYKITGHVHGQLLAANYEVTTRLVEGATVFSVDNMVSAAFTSVSGALHMEAIVTPSAASHTYKVQGLTGPSTGGSGTISDSTTGPGFILVEDIGT